MTGTQERTGLEALALGALAAGVRVMTGYPGSPATGLWSAVVQEADRERGPLLHAEWSVNEKVAFEVAFGAATTGLDSLVVCKGVGFNVLIDPVMTANLSGVLGGLVIAVGDDPGAEWSQNEQDTRPLAAACQLPLLEPGSVAAAPQVMGQAFTLSRRLRLPVVVRFTGGFAGAAGVVELPAGPGGVSPAVPASADFPSDGRLRSTARRAVRLHENLYRKLEEAAVLADRSTLNRYQDRRGASRAVVAAGYAGVLLQDVLRVAAVSPAIYSLTTTHPLPGTKLTAFLAGRDEALVLEDGGSFVEDRLTTEAARARLSVRILGRRSGHVPRTGQLTAEHVRAALTSGLAGPAAHQPDRSGHAGFCDECPFVRVFELLGKLGAELAAKRSRPLFVADPGCAVYADLPPFELLDVKQVLGSSIAVATGVALALPERRVIAVSGDGSFFHSGIQSLLEAAGQRAPVGVILLDNAAAAMTGFQPTPVAVATGGRRPHRPDLSALMRACGAGRVSRVTATNPRALLRRLKQLLFSRRMEVLIVKGSCPSDPRRSSG